MPLAVTFDFSLVGAVVLTAHGMGLASSWDAVMTGRTPQGTMAWIFSLLVFPYVAVPMYWVFGRRRYKGYEDARRAGYGPIQDIAAELREAAGEFIVELEGPRRRYEVLEHLVQMPFTRGNDAELLIDGEATFDALFAAIQRAERYVLVQFFIVRLDVIGRKFLACLCERAKAGVAVSFLYDEVGSRELEKAFRATLAAAGGRMEPFSTTRGPDNRFQLNFRNHRKVLVVDGREAFLGGINVGDEYLGHGRLGAWRDTFVRLEGPVVQGVQLAFLEDWHWATDEVPEWDWQPRASQADRCALILPTGPADLFETASLVFVTLIHSAQERLWITSPYFVFDNQLLGALELAALRGVDVRVIVPENGDYRLVERAAWTYFDDVQKAGVRMYRFGAGFMHQKMLLVDDETVLFGTKNLDNRSQRLNFEISVLLLDPEFAAIAAESFERDLEGATLVPDDALANQSLLFRFSARFARLFAPIL